MLLVVLRRGCTLTVPRGECLMEEDAVVPDPASLAADQLRTSMPDRLVRAEGPDFLIIAPGKTGTTWLAANLRCHPAVFVPAVKEVKYFSSYCQWFDLDWYLDHFAPGAGRV